MTTSSRPARPTGRPGSRRGRRRAAGATAGVRPASTPSRSTEDYLERIGELIECKGYARVGDLATSLAVSQPSVTAMVQRLADSGYLHYRKYRGLVLTDEGRAVADRIKDRHLKLKRFLSLLGLDEQVQEDDIEGWEHCLSAATVSCLNDLADFLEARPELLRAFHQRKRTGAGRARGSKS